MYEGNSVTAETIHELKLRIWKQPAKKRAEYLSDLETATGLPAGDQKNLALADIAKRLQRAESLGERNKKRKEAAVKTAEEKLRKDLGF
jgi:hypothetical protein